MSNPPPNSGEPEELRWPQSNPDPNPNYPLEIPEAHVNSEESNNSDELFGVHSNSDGPLGVVPNLFRLLDLVDEHGSEGIIQKIVIDQDSLRRFLNLVQPGSYESVSKINFKALDELSIKPVGIYGTHSEIVKFLQEAQYLDTNSANLLSRTNSPVGSSSAIPSGLYLALDPNHQSQGTSKLAYMIYWPEDTTWDDQVASSSIKRNRVLFMRYLHKLTDQMIALVSSSQARAFVWEETAYHEDPPVDQPEDENDARLFEFEVTEPLEQKEDVVGTPGFTIAVESRVLPQGHDQANSRVGLVPGEQKTALLVVRHEKEQSEVEHFDSNVSPMNLKKMIESKDCPLQLGNLSPTDLEVLAAHGLRSQHRGIFAKYDGRIRELKAEQSRMENPDKKGINEKILRDRPKILEEIQHLVRITYDKLYPSLKLMFDVSHDPEVTALLHQDYPGLNKVADEVARKQKPDVVSDREFQSLKGKWGLVKGYLEQNPNQSDDEHRNFIKSVLNGTYDQASAREIAQTSSRRFNWGAAAWPTSPTLPASSTWAPSWPLRSSGDYSDATTNLGSNPTLPSNPTTRISDPEFVLQLQTMQQTYPALSGLMRKVHDALGRNLETLENKVIADQLDRIASMERRRQNSAASGARGHAYREGLQRTFEVVMRELREAMVSSACRLRHVDWIRSIQGGQSQGQDDNAQFHWGGRVTSLRPAQNRHSIYPLELTEQDSHLCQADGAHIPQPKVDTRHKFELTLQKGRSVEFVQLVRDKCLVAVSEPGRTHIFIENSATIDHAVNATHGKASLSHDAFGGPQRKFAFDQTTRLLAVVHGNENDLKLSIYIFDEMFANLQSRSSPISLKNWYNNRPIDLRNICFVSGVEEVCLVETSGRVRIFSLVTQQFRAVSLQIDRPIVDAFSAPDGSCLLVVVPGNHSSSHRLLAFHWASFGTNKRGIDSTGLGGCDGHRVATRFDGRGRVHVVSFDAASRALTSTVLQITQKANDFSFRKKGIKKINNSLIDCHLEVWRQFPVVPAVARNTPIVIDRQPRELVFASSVGLQGVGEYFVGVISAFENTSWKPIGETLTAMRARGTSKFGRNIVDKISEFKLGSFIVELLCLIPLHLAVMRGNHFIPLKDGVWDPEYERSLLGADVPGIVDALSLGWYESLLQSYMATKPVRVVSSMGEQNIGKSYSLNHLADTSFAGSAMRAAEGIWLSCTPTDEHLLVSLNFKGVHSTRRTTQEDALLVLFNTAISNLVLFHDNFAISTNILNLFKSFQSSATVIDPNVNKRLFNSTLVIIIKDVTNADSKEIIKKLSLEFQGTVEKERDRNFITRLHRGHIQIVPWPSANSHNFYTTLGRLRQKLNQQPFTHDSCGAFLHNLKTLMAKVTISDWGSMDQNVATHRAHQLMERLPNALSCGRLEEGPLKNMYADMELDIPDYMPLLFIPEFTTGKPVESAGSAEEALRALIKSCGQSIGTRHQIPDTSYVEILQKSLYDSLDQRLALVQKWVDVNIECFPPGNRDIRNLTNKLHAASIGMRNAVRLCSSGCSSCQLLCLRPYRHYGEHSCGTSHRCVFDCEVVEDHSQRDSCGLPAGHRGRHMCDVRAHSCGFLCHLSVTGGCARACIKPLDHEGQHICSAQAHICGKPCDLRNVGHGNNGGLYSCPGTCTIPWNEPHERHACDNTRACPIECILCQRPCCSMDHFHGLDSKAVHLCDQEHNCAKLCESDGICQIETRPFVAQNQPLSKYIRSTQVGHRLSCAIPISPGKLSHEGAHTHDAGENAFHFCDVRCPNCEYFCRLPFGHDQQLHDTGHGSVITTRWRKLGSPDEAVPLLCNFVCLAQGRHAHIDYCRDPGNCSNTGCQHISELKHSGPDGAMDWISHDTFWARTGFKDPYPYEERNEFSKCDVFCPGPEHKTSDIAPANPSYCTLPLFHAPVPQEPAPPTGYVSRDGHAFDCQDPSRIR